MNIEFFGLPGVGKTTLASALVDAIGVAGGRASLATARVGPEETAVLRYLTKAGKVGVATMRHPLASLHLLRATAGSAQESLGQVLKRWADFMVAQAILSSSRRSQSAVLDQGVFQAVWSMGLRGDISGPLERLTESQGVWILPDLLIVVDAPVTEVIDRLRARPSRHSRVQDGDAGMALELERGRRLMETLLDESQAMGLAADSIVTVENVAGCDATELMSPVARLATADAGGRSVDGREA